MLKLNSIFFILLLFFGCNRSNNEFIKKDGEILFPFSFENVSEFQWSVNDPVKDLKFNARFIKDSKKTSKGRKALWLISEVSEEYEIKDRLADSVLMEKLLDYLSTLKTINQAPDQNPENYGLHPFHYAFRWKIPEFSFELILGEKLGKSSQRYAQFQILPHDKKLKQRWDSKAIYIVDGAALKYLDIRLKSFTDVRLKKFLPMVKDDAYFITLKKGKQLLFSAERDGSHWKKTKGSDPKFSLKETIEFYFRYNILEFYEDPKELSKIQKKFKKLQNFTLEISIRTQEKSTMNWIEAGDGHIIAQTSLRPHVYFLLSPSSKE